MAFLAENPSIIADVAIYGMMARGARAQESRSTSRFVFVSRQEIAKNYQRSMEWFLFAGF
jgi:hypothetical protein